MKPFDSVELVCETGDLPTINRDRCRPAGYETGTVWTAGKRQLREFDEALGLAGIRDDGHSVSLWFSSKIHGPDCLDGTHADNLDALAHRLVATGFVDRITPDQLAGARCTRADPFIDLDLGPDLPAYVQAMHVVTATGGDRFVKRGKRRKTPTFYLTPPSGMIPTRQYGKGADMGKAKNKLLRQVAPDLERQTAGLLRVEGMPRGVAHLRRIAWMESGTPTFHDLLTSDATPLSDSLDYALALWEGISRKPMPLPSIPDTVADALDAFGGLSPVEAAKRLLARHALDLAGGDLDAAREILRQNHGKNWKRTLDGYLTAEATRREASRAGLTRSPDRDPVPGIRSILADVCGAVRAAETA